MALTWEEVENKREWLVGQLTSALKEEFNLQGLRIIHGITLNKDNEPDFAIRICDMNNPDGFVGNDAVLFAKQKIQNLIPGSMPDVVAMTVPRLR